MSEAVQESQEAPVQEVDPRITEIAKRWKRVKKIETELKDMRTSLNEKRSSREKAIIEAQHAELEGVAGNDEFRKRFEHQREKIRRLRAHMIDLSDEHKAQKALLKVAREELEELDKADKEAALPLIAGAQPNMDEAWRDTPIEHLTKIAKKPLTETIINKLQDAGFTTIGKLAEYKSAGSWYTDIDGIGEATSDKIDDAFEQFFTEGNALAAAAAPSEEPAAPVVSPFLNKPLEEVDGVPAEAAVALAKDKIFTLADLQARLDELGEDGALWLSTTVGEEHAAALKTTIGNLAQQENKAA